MLNQINLKILELRYFGKIFIVYVLNQLTFNQKYGRSVYFCLSTAAPMTFV